MQIDLKKRILVNDNTFHAILFYQVVLRMVGFFILVMVVCPKVSYFQKPYFSKELQLQNEEDVSWPFHGIYSMLFGQNIWSAVSCVLSSKLLGSPWAFFGIFRMHPFLLILGTDINEYSYWKIWNLSNCKNYWEDFKNSGKSFDNVILVKSSLRLLKNETCSNLCYACDWSYFCLEQIYFSQTFQSRSQSWQIFTLDQG